MSNNSEITVGFAQISYVWLNKAKTLEKVSFWIKKAASQKCNLVAFGEALVPGYPFWVELTNSPEFNSKVQKELFGHYSRNAVNIESGDLDAICDVAKNSNIAVYLGIIERPSDRGGHSLYCS